MCVISVGVCLINAESGADTSKKTVINDQRSCYGIFQVGGCCRRNLPSLRKRRETNIPFFLSFSAQSMIVTRSANPGAARAARVATVTCSVKVMAVRGANDKSRQRPHRGYPFKDLIMSRTHGGGRFTINGDRSDRFGICGARVVSQINRTGTEDQRLLLRACIYLTS